MDIQDIYGNAPRQLENESLHDVLKLSEVKQINSLQKANIDNNNPYYVCQFKEDNWIFDYFLKIKGNSSLYVSFAGAQDIRPKNTPLRHLQLFTPRFNRWSWVQSFNNFDAICISDPTIRLENAIGGWYQGYKDDWVFLKIIYHLIFLQTKFKYKKIILNGCSMGAFAALQAGVLIPIFLNNLSTKQNMRPEILILAENAQISVYEYAKINHLEQLAMASYGVNEISEIPEKYAHRLDIVELIKNFNFIPKGIVLMKESDIYHCEYHLKHLLNGIKNDKARANLKIELIPKHLDNSGHTPLNLFQLKFRLDYLNLITADYYLKLLENTNDAIDFIKNNKNIKYSDTMIQIEPNDYDIKMIEVLLPKNVIFIDSYKSKFHKINKQFGINYELYNVILDEFCNYDSQRITSLDSFILCNRIVLKQSILLNINTDYKKILPILRGSINTLKFVNTLMVNTKLNEIDKSIPIDLAIFLHSLNFKCIKLFSYGCRVTALFIQK